MKLLNPFAGYRAASGHIFYHVVFFLASFSINIFGNEIRLVKEFDYELASESEIEAHDYLETAVFAAQLLRYCHALVVALDVACYILDNWEPSLEKRAKIGDEHTVDVQGLSLQESQLIQSKSAQGHLNLK